MNQVVVDMNKSNMKHGHYVARSRVTKKSGLHIINLNEEKIKQDSSVVNEMKKLQTKAIKALLHTSVCYGTVSLDICISQCPFFTSPH